MQLTSYLCTWKNSSFNVIHIVKTYVQVQVFFLFGFSESFDRGNDSSLEIYSLFELWDTILSWSSYITRSSFSSFFVSYLPIFWYQNIEETQYSVFSPFLFYFYSPDDLTLTHEIYILAISDHHILSFSNLSPEVYTCLSNQLH